MIDLYEELQLKSERERLAREKKKKSKMKVSGKSVLKLKKIIQEKNS